MRLALVPCFISFIHGFLLDSKNSSVQVSPTFLTTAEYYGDKSQTQRELNILRQTMANYHQTQQENQERTLNLLVSQIQAKLGAFEQKLTEKNSNNTQNQQQAKGNEQKFQELEAKYEEMRNSSEAWKQMYFELETRFTEMNHTFVTTMQDFFGMRIEYTDLKDLQLAQKQEMEKMKQLKTIDQLQTINNVNQKTQDLDSKVSSIEKMEKARDQDFLALIQTVANIENDTQTQKLEQLTFLNATNENIKAQLVTQNNTMKDIENMLRTEITQAQTNVSQKTQDLDSKVSSIEKMDKARDQNFLALIQTVANIENDTQVQKLEQLKILNATNENIKAQLVTQNNTMRAMENKLRTELTQAQTTQSQKVTQIQNQLDQLSKQVLLMACFGHDGDYASSGALRFSSIKTSVGISYTYYFRNYGKFRCEEPGYYFVEVTIESIDNGVYINIMVNQASQRAQYITGDTNNRWMTGSSSGIFHLRTNDEVWIKINDRIRISHACINIFKIK